MKQTAIVALAAGALVLGLTACGSGSSAESSGLRKETATSAAAKSAAPVASTPAAPPIEPPAGAPATTATAAKKTSAPNGAQTTCGEFRDLDGDTEKQVIQQVLSANPGSKFDGSPNVALGTAKLACLAQTYANTPVANAIGAAK
ncbi:hypothetical protein OHB26_13490 [Nocardia sp. NBC_01503]|uniref:hypothetical protein n=1 Tax=Nocardia sp. NBC_01503 TaxID=2975997 RepID=UPI002E7B914B|nr:hypothetical protein [Nocardia sp. NBC_01503]WTL35113.1 hypothetical protein OHB26_13490 [Nocardia sp. NBC_01503]